MEYAQELSSLKCHVETGNDEISNCVVPSDKYLPMLTIVISGIEYVRTARKFVLDDIYYHLSRLDYIFSFSKLANTFLTLKFEKQNNTTQMLSWCESVKYGV